MGLIENDPRDTAYIALFMAIIFYTEISPEQARRIAEGKSNMKPGKRLSSETMEAVNKIIRHPSFCSYKNIEKRFQVNRYDIFEKLKRQKVN